MLPEEFLKTGILKKTKILMFQNIKFSIKEYRIFCLCYPQVTHEFPQQISANLVQQFGQLHLTYIHTYIRTNTYLTE